MSKFLKHCRRHTAAMLAFGIALAAPSAWAAGTASGTNVSNNAQVSYEVGGVAQNVQSNTATFKVDNIVRVLVAETNSAATPVTLGAAGSVVIFTVTNQGNTSQDYSLATANLINGTLLTLGANDYTDAFDATACVVRVESGTTAGYQAGEDTAAAIVNLAADGSKTVYVVCTIPTGLANGADAVVSLTATTANANTCAANGTGCVTTTQTAGADNLTQVDVVFGDAAGTDDSNRDGKHSARDAYEVAAALSISKTVTPICDPINFNVNPKNIPGAYVRYEITVSNAAGSGQSATLTQITDVLPASLAYDPDLRTGSDSACASSAPASVGGSGFRLACSGGSRACTSGFVYYTGAPDSDAVTVAAPNVTVTAGNGPGGTKFLPSEGAGLGAYAQGELKPGESITIRFNAIIQ